MRINLCVKRLVVASSLLYGASVPSHAQDASVYLSDRSVQGRVDTAGEDFGLGAADLSAGIFVNDDDDLIGDIGASVSNDPAGLTPWLFSAGARLYGGSIDILDDNFLSVGIGGEVGYQIPTRWPSRLTGSLYYAPKIASFGDVDRLFDLGIDYEVGFTENWAGFFGYRFFEADLDDGGDRELDDNLHLGVRYSF